MAAIRSRVIQSGHEKEGEWPSKYGTGEAGYFRPEAGKYEIQRFGDAPYVIQDTMEPYYHPAIQAKVSSRSMLRTVDKACGTITSDKLIPPDPTWQNEQRAARLKDKQIAHRKALNALKQFGDGALPEDKRHECKEINESLSKKVGIDLNKVLRRKDGSWK